jgi:hypothetical protein
MFSCNNLNLNSRTTIFCHKCVVGWSVDLGEMSNNHLEVKTCYNYKDVHKIVVVAELKEKKKSQYD